MRGQSKRLEQIRWGNYRAIAIKENRTDLADLYTPTPRGKSGFIFATAYQRSANQLRDRLIALGYLSESPPKRRRPRFSKEPKSPSVKDVVEKWTIFLHRPKISEDGLREGLMRMAKEILSLHF